MQLSSHSRYHDENVARDQSLVRRGESPLKSARPSRHTWPASAPVATSHRRSAHPLWHIGKAPFIRADDQYRSSKTAIIRSASSSCSGVGFKSGKPEVSFHESVNWKGWDRVPTKPSPSLQGFRSNPPSA